MSFDGDDYVQIKDSALVGNNNVVTVEAWVKLPNVNSCNHIYVEMDANGEVFDLYIYLGTARFGVYIGTTWYQAIGATTLGVNTWYHIVGTLDSSGMKVYVNGSLDGTNTNTNPCVKTIVNVRIGMSTYGPSYFTGTIDEPRIYNRALSASEIKAHYEAKAKLNYGDVRFTDSDGTTELTTAGQGNYWMEKDGTFWVKVPSISASSTKTIYMYYGKSDASQIYNGSATFEFFDDFESYSTGDLNGQGGWTASTYIDVETAGPYQGSKNIINNGDDHYLAFKTLPITNNFIFEGYTNCVDAGSDGGIGIFTSDVTTSGTANNGRAVLWVRPAPAASNLSFFVDGVQYNRGAIQIQGAYAYSKITYYDGNYTLIYADGAGNRTMTGSCSYTPAKVGIYAERDNTRFDVIRVRKYASTEPAYSSVGTEESYTLKANYWNCRLPVTITNGGSAQYNYQVSVTVDTATPIAAGHMNSDCSDIRFSSTSDYDEEDWDISYPYWIESGANSATTKIWVKIDSIAGTPTTTTIYLYYGNQGALSASSYSNTMQKLKTDSNTVSLLHMDEGTGTIAVDEVNAHNGTLTSGASWVGSDGGNWDNKTPVQTFATGNAVNFYGTAANAGSADNIYFGAGDVFGIETMVSGGTVEIWFRPTYTIDATNHGNYIALINFAAGVYGLRWWPNEGNLTFYMYNSFYTDADEELKTSQVSWTAGTWYHAATTWGDAGRKFYINGVLVAENTAITGTSNYAAASWGCRIGIDQAGGVHDFVGDVDEFIILNRTKSAAEIKADYERRKYASTEPVATAGSEEVGLGAQVMFIF